MGPLDALWHLGNFFLPALALAALTAAAAKLLWRRELAGIAWRRLAVGAAAANVAVVLGSLVLLGRDGKMVTYGAMVLACTLALWWLGFGPGRRRVSRP